MHDPLEVAQRIGHRLARTARWNGEMCAWKSVPTGKRPDLMMPWQVDPTVYRGTAGVGIFLTELYGETRDPEVLRAARGALLHASNHIDSMSLRWSAYSGLVGVAYALGRLAAVSGDARAGDGARALLRRLEKTDTHMPGDIITGAAGAIPQLTQLTHIVDRGTIERLVHRLATAIQNGAVHTVEGTAWRGALTAHRPLTGFAHGASGYAYALLTAWQFCGASRYLYTALQAMLYERLAYGDADIGNWPDYRHSEFGKLVWELDAGSFQSLIRSGWEPGPYELRGMHAWCHGSPGIGFVRLRAAERLGIPWLRQEAEAAADATLRSFDVETHNWSLCHGIAGNSEFLMAAAEGLRRDDLRARVMALAADGDDAFERRGISWPSGTTESLRHDGLLIGDAGVGLHYLRLAAPHVPSVLFPPLPEEAHPSASDLTDATAYRHELMRRLFRHTSGAASNGDDFAGLLGEWDVRSSTPDLSTIVSRVRRRGSTRTNRARRQAVTRDLAYVQPRERQLSDVQLRMDELLMRPGAEIEWSRTRFRLRGHIAVHGVQSGRKRVPTAAFMVQPSVAGQGTLEELQPLSALVLDAYTSDASIDDVVSRISPYVDGGTPARLRALVEQQTRSAYVAGVLTCAPESNVGSGASSAEPVD
jgi:lantibiotic biosynthesis protein